MGLVREIGDAQRDIWNTSDVMTLIISQLQNCLNIIVAIRRKVFRAQSVVFKINLFWAMMLWHSNLSVKHNETKCTIWRNPFITSVSKRTHLVQTISWWSGVFLRLRASPFTLNECSQLVYCSCCEFSARLGTTVTSSALLQLQMFTAFH